MKKNTGAARYARHFLRCVYTGLAFIVLIVIVRELMHSVESISQRIVWVIQHMPAIDPQYVEVLAAVVPAAFVLWAVLRIGVPLHKIVKDYRKATTLKRSRDFFWMRVQQAMPKCAKPLLTQVRREHVPWIEQKIKDVGVAVYPYVCTIRRQPKKRKTK